MASRVRAPAAIPPTPRRDAIAGPNGSRRAVPPAHRYSTECSRQSARITPTKEDSTDWFGARCSRCSRNEERGNRRKRIWPADSESGSPPAPSGIRDVQ